MIEYTEGSKYQLAKHYVRATGITPNFPGSHGFLSIDSDGKLSIDAGYTWDGPSGPAIDSKNFMRASLVHDALYQLTRLGVIGTKQRSAIDREMRMICREAGMGWFRSWYCWAGVRIGGAGAADPLNRRKILTAP